MKFNIYEISMERVVNGIRSTITIMINDITPQLAVKKVKKEMPSWEVISVVC